MISSISSNAQSSTMQVLASQSHTRWTPNGALQRTSEDTALSINDVYCLLNKENCFKALINSQKKKNAIKKTY